ncbi:hypothetical protein HYDPIDRAFT_28920 [Hydnomerulius pinastri MD-312]|uniref:FAR-17a/AIG1-like protein n=1 Tax=Hydnomerulius pinastri MD-312 TaxID=994086 RepID=A0A0C9WEL7_9AGAM|nr:hypothetical protein HYDPIDRAFT_28920 [Hydnomerulius pinastri MD-312]
MKSLRSPKFSLSYEWFGVAPQFDPTFKFVTSPVFSPSVLGALRLLLAVYTLVTTITVLAFESVVYHDSKSFLSYFTDLSYIGLVAYFWASSVQTIAFALRGQTGYPLQSWPRILQLLHVFLYSSIVVFPIIVTVVFWSLLASPSTFQSRYSAWSNISQHAMNSGFALFEILLTHAGPSPWSHLVPVFILLACYLGVAYITYATQGFYTYGFLNPAKEHGLLAAYIVGIAIGYCVVFTVVKGICLLRWRLSLRYSSEPDNSPPEALDEWQDVEQPKDSSVSEA